MIDDTLRYIGPVVSVVRALLPLEWAGPCFMGKTQVPFKPDGLAIWGAELAKVSVQCIRNGNTIDAITAIGPIPAQFFSLLPGQGFQQLAEMMERDEAPHGWAEFGTIVPGVFLQIEVTRDGKPIGPADGVEMAMWGRSFR
ncbi:MAG TPA: hypothetical protein VGI10_06200 [Polyangiaceae bacterium]|jgi:hypothetical protein